MRGLKLRPLITLDICLIDSLIDRKRSLNKLFVLLLFNFMEKLFLFKRKNLFVCLLYTHRPFVRSGSNFAQLLFITMSNYRSKNLLSKMGVGESKFLTRFSDLELVLQVTFRTLRNNGVKIYILGLLIHLPQILHSYS